MTLDLYYSAYIILSEIGIKSSLQTSHHNMWRGLQTEYESAWVGS